MKNQKIMECIKKSIFLTYLQYYNVKLNTMNNTNYQGLATHGNHSNFMCSQVKFKICVKVYIIYKNHKKRYYIACKW